MIIYLAVNRVNGKAYVGQTRYPLATRISTHLWRGRYVATASYFQRAMAKYGVGSFDFAVLEECDSKPFLNEAERRWIKHFGCMAPGGYNVAAGGEGSLWDKRSDAWHRAVRDPEYRKRKSDQAKAWRAKQTPEERSAHNAKVGAANRGRKCPQHIGDGNPAKRMENRIKISEGQRISWADPEVRARRLAGFAAAIAKRKAAQRESNF